MTPYATSIRLGSDLRLDLFTSDLFRVRMATAAGGSPGPDRSDDMDMFRLHDDTATHAQPRLKIQDEVLVAPDPFAPELDIPFCCGRVDAWPAVSHRHQRQGALEVITTDRLQIQVDVQRRSATVWTADGARRLFPDDSPRFGFFQGQCAHFAVDYTISAASCFYDPAVVKTAGDYIAEGLPIKWEALRPDVLYELLNHSDCDGEIQPYIAGPLAERLDELLYNMPEQWQSATEGFIKGLLAASAANEVVDFH